MTGEGRVPRQLFATIDGGRTVIVVLTGKSGVNDSRPSFQNRQATGSVRLKFITWSVAAAIIAVVTLLCLALAFYS